MMPRYEFVEWGRFGGPGVACGVDFESPDVDFPDLLYLTC